MPVSPNPPAPSADVYARFWTLLLEHARVHTSLHVGVRPAAGPQLTAAQGAIRWSYVLDEESAGARLEMAWEEAQARDTAFQRLFEHRKEIERACGRRMEWQPSRPGEGVWPSVTLPAAEFGIEDPGDWAELRQCLVEAMLRLTRACRPFLPGGTGEAARPIPEGLATRLDSGDSAALAELFEAEMIHTYYVLGEVTGSWANYFLKDVRMRGGVEAARQMLVNEQPLDILEGLKKAGQLAISVEALVLRPEYEPLYTDEEREIARERLRAFGYPA